MAKKKSPFHPDMTHLHHVFVNVGVSHFITAMTEVLIMITVVVIWWISVHLGASVEWQLYIVIIAAILLVWGTYWIINYHAQNHTEFLHRLVRFNVKTHLGRTEWWKRFTGWLDNPEDKLVSKLESNAPTSNMMENDSPEADDEKEQDRRRILDFMKGRAEVMVHDIVGYSGADKQRVFPILYEEELNGRVRVIKRTDNGVPEIVALL